MVVTRFLHSHAVVFYVRATLIDTVLMLESSEPPHEGTRRYRG